MRLNTTTMNQLTEPRRTVDELSVGDQESDFDDDDRRELISHYANDKYLSKWELAEEDEEEEEKNWDNELPSKEGPEEIETDNRKTVRHLVATLDCDHMSLVSYNSVTDCNPPATPKTVPEPVHYQLGLLPQSTSEELKLWKGYGGNIYFDAVRCQSMRINSSKSRKSRKEGISKRWKSKSCTPLNRRDERQSHHSGVSNSPKETPQASIHSLGSLRMRSASKDKKCKTATCRHSESTRHLPGKICKGFSEKLITETFQRFQENGGCRLTKEPLAVSGGQVGDSIFDPIDKVRQFNTQCKGKDFALNFENGFPALLTDSSFFSHGDHRSSAGVTNDTEPFIKLPVLGKTEAKHKTNKAGSGNSDENSKKMNEPRQVFIIPFGAFDDPVDVESDSKRKADKKEKPSAKVLGDGIKTVIKDVSKPSEELEKNSTESNLGVEMHTIDVYGEKDSGLSVQQPNIIASAEMVRCETSPVSSGSIRQNQPDFHLKREISNLSLSNYLRAVPTRGTKEQNSPTSPRSSAMVPKMSYTNRSRALPTFYMVNNSLQQVQQSGFNPQKLNGSHVYGGYFPTTGRKESKLFYAEISTISEQSQANGDESMQELSRRTNKSSSKKGNLNAQIPKHTFVKASYVSRKSFSRQNVERSPRVNDALRKSEKNLLHVPVTGHQLSSRFNGVNDR
ncbi:uncharacterized protein LOC144654451 [Oculina patagonica]